MMWPRCARLQVDWSFKGAAVRNVLFILAVLSTTFCAAVNAYTYRLAYPLWRWVGAKEFGTLHTPNTSVS